MANFGEEIIEGALTMATILILIAIMMSLCGCTTVSVPVMTYCDDAGTTRVAYAEYKYLLQDKSFKATYKSIQIDFNSKSDPVVDAIERGIKLAHEYGIKPAATGGVPTSLP